MRVANSSNALPAVASAKALPFTVQEYQHRIARVQAAMARTNLDVMFATTLASVCYLTGIESVSPHKLWAVAVPREGKPILFCQDFESHNARLSSWVDAEFTYPVGGDALPSLTSMLKESGFDRAKIGMELSHCWSSLPVRTFLQLQTALAGATFVDATDCVGRVMAMKSPAEIDCIRRAARITASAMDCTIDALREGITDNDVAAVAYESLVRGGSEYAAYPVIVTTGSRSGIPHSTFRRVPIGRGDPVFIELAAAINRYHAPMMRTAVIGKSDARLRTLADAATACVKRVIDEIRPGRNVAEIAAAAKTCLANLDEGIVWHGYYGYSVGLGFPPEWSDCPSLIIRLDGSDVLRAGMVFHVSTSLRDVGVCGATFSETVLVTETGAEVLTNTPRDLRVAL